MSKTIKELRAGLFDAWNDETLSWEMLNAFVDEFEESCIEKSYVKGALLRFEGKTFTSCSCPHCVGVRIAFENLMKELGVGRD